jgi:hypothetical protein
MNVKTRSTLTAIGCLLFSVLSHSQHNNEFYNNGTIVHVQAGAEIHVRGDVHMYGAAGTFENYGLVTAQGNSYSDNLFQQRGTGTYRIHNPNVNIGERQFIQGSYAVRGGQAQTGVNDGSFYNLELANDQGIVYLVGAGNVADVRNQVDFLSGAVQNRIITHNVGMVGPLVYPANGSGYTGVFGDMNPTASLVSMVDNTITINGNMSAIDAGYVQGKHRRAISAAGGQYGYIMGVEPAGAGMERGVQYIRLNFTANNYDVVTGYFESGSPNAMASPIECSGNTINYYGGVDHGEWFFEDITTTGAGTYDVTVWPQDDNFIAAPLWVITKDNALSGTANQCGPTPVGLVRGGYNGFTAGAIWSEFDVAAITSLLPIDLLDINAHGNGDHILVNWNVATEIDLSHYDLERSENGVDFDKIAEIDPQGGQNQLQSYYYPDHDVRFFQNYYYRVKSVDYNGASDYSPIVVASLSTSDVVFGEDFVNVFPNPSAGDYSLGIVSSEKLSIDLAIYNTMGQLISSRQFVTQEGNTVLQIEAKDWAPGVYYIDLKEVVSGQSVVKKLIKN